MDDRVTDKLGRIETVLAKMQKARTYFEAGEEREGDSLLMEAWDVLGGGTLRDSVQKEAAK